MPQASFGDGGRQLDREMAYFSTFPQHPSLKVVHPCLLNYFLLTLSIIRVSYFDWGVPDLTKVILSISLQFEGLLIFTKGQLLLPMIHCNYRKFHLQYLGRFVCYLKENMSPKVLKQCTSGKTKWGEKWEWSSLMGNGSEYICVQEFDSLHTEAEIQRGTNSLKSGTG